MDLVCLAFPACNIKVFGNWQWGKIVLKLYFHYWRRNMCDLVKFFKKKTTGIEDYEKLEKNYNNINF